MSVCRLLLAGVPALLLLTGCREQIEIPSPAPVPQRSETAIQLRDVTQAAGLDFRHEHGGTGRHYYIETMGGGCAFLDYDGDGKLDIFLVQSGSLPGYEADRPLSHALFRNQGDGTFRDVTESARFGSTSYGLGCCTADFDNDGYPDLFVTGLERNCLYVNNGDGTFREADAECGIGGTPMCTSASFVDYDHDGLLDLIIGRYMDYDLKNNPRCKDQSGRPAYCMPSVYEGTNCLLYRNEGDGRFTDVTDSSGVGAARGRAMGIAAADFDVDGWIDLFVSCDLSPNLLFLNNRDGTFREEGASRGSAYAQDGIARAGMGVDCADFNNDQLLDIVVTNFENEPNSLFRGEPNGMFVDATLGAGLDVSRPYVGWGVHFVDLDLDGWQDLFVVNGHVNDYADELQRGKGYGQTARVYRNDGRGRFGDVSSGAGEFFARRQVARGAAFGDYDDDGRMDVLISCNNQPAILLHNESAPAAPRLRVALRGRGCNRDAIGARIVARSGSLVQTQVVRSATSYLCDHDRRIIFANPSDEPSELEITWPCGNVQRQIVSAGPLVWINEDGCRGHKHGESAP